MAKEKKFRDGKKKRPKKEKKRSKLSEFLFGTKEKKPRKTSSKRAFKKKKKRYTYEDYLRWQRSRTSGLSTDDLKTDVTLCIEEGCVIEEINLNVDENKLEAKEQQTKKSLIANALRNL